MSISPWLVRVLMVVSATFFLAVGLGIRAITDGVIGQYSGAALSGAIVYAIVLFVRPPISPVVAGGIATVCCWVVEFFQLTGVPATLSQRSLLARLVLGAQFDIIDVAWYPVGIVPLAVLHWFLRVRARTQAQRAAASP